MKNIILVAAIASFLGGCASVETFREKHGFMPKHIKHIAPVLPPVVVQPVAPVVVQPPTPQVPSHHTQKKRTIKWLFGNRAK